MKHTDFSSLAEELAGHVEGVVDGYRLVSCVGSTRSEAFGSGGTDLTRSLVSGDDVAAQVHRFASDVQDRHETGPAAFAWVVLRKTGKSGNVAASAPFQVGGESPAAALTNLRDAAVSRAIDMGPLTLNLLAKLLTHSITERKEARKSEFEMATAVAGMIGAAEADDDSAKWESLASAAKDLGPVAAQAVGAWVQSMGLGEGGPAAQTAEAVASQIRGLPESERAKLVAAILTELGIETPGASKDEGDAAPAGDA